MQSKGCKKIKSLVFYSHFRMCVETSVHSFIIKIQKLLFDEFWQTLLSFHKGQVTF